jgi:hypothetical protein
MKLYSVRTVGISAALLLASISPGELSAQSAATMHLMELINAGDIDSVEETLPRATIDAGPPASSDDSTGLDRIELDRLLERARTVEMTDELDPPPGLRR